MAFFETSAKSATNIDLAFQTIAKTIMDKMNLQGTRDAAKGGVKLKEIKAEQPKQNNSGGGGCC